MGFNATGVYTPAAGALTAAPGGIIKSSVWNAIFTDMSNAFTTVAQSRFLLNTLTASNSATLGDTTSLTSTFKDYEIVFDNILPGTNASFLEFQVHSGGTFQATAYVNSCFGTNTSTTIVNTSATVTYLPLGVVALNSAAANGLSGTIKIHGPVTGSSAKFIVGTTAAQSAGPIVTSVVGGFWNSSSAIDGFQILFSAGNIVSGTVKVYGLL